MPIIELVFVRIAMDEAMSFSPYSIPIFAGVLLMTLTYFIHEMYLQE